MTGPKRRILLFGSYALVAALAATAAAYVTRQWEPGYSTPLRADFPRRLASQGDAGKGSYRFFYATSRAPAADGVDDDAATQPSDEVSLGSFEARISPAITVRPSVWEDPELLDVSRPQAMAPSPFFAQLRAGMERSPHRSVLILVWGWKERWLTAAAKTAYVSYMLDIGTPVVVFDWPANQGSNVRGYLASHSIGRASGAKLGQFVESVVEQVRPDNLWLVAMSMGSQVVCDAFDYMAGRANLQDAEQEIAHVVLVAPDVGEDEFDQQFAAQIGRLSKQLTVYVSSTDQALLLSQWVNRGSRVGRIAKARPDALDQAQFASGDRLLALGSAVGREIEVVDVTPINRHRNRHNFLTDDPEFLDELYHRLLRPQDPVSRRLYPVRTDRGVTLWILWDQ